MRARLSAVIGTAISAAILLLHYAKNLADFFALLHLPTDVQEALKAMPHIPSFIDLAALGICAFCVGYLLWDIFWKNYAATPDAPALNWSTRDLLTKVTQPQWVTGIFIVVALVGGSWIYSSQPEGPKPAAIPIEIAGEFTRLRADKSVSSLGNPVEPVKASPGTYQAAFDQANVLWLSPFITFFVLPNDSTRKGMAQADRIWLPGTYKESDLRREFRVPNNRLPPYGGIIDQWRKDFERWKWIGFIEWHCSFGPGEIYYQQFEKGLLVGPFHLDRDTGSGRMFVIRDDGTWSQVASIPAQPCKRPP
jgi:hypothetical protein